MYDYRCTCLLDKRKKCEVGIPQRLLNVWWHAAENLRYLHFLVVYCAAKHTEESQENTLKLARAVCVVMSQDRSIHDTVVYSPGVLHI